MRLGIVDTMFSRVNMGEIAINELNKNYKVEIVRRTVPGIKDLAVECKKLLELEKCDVTMALGMVGSAPIDLQCAHEASLGIQQAKLMTNKHIIEVFVHENEAWSEKEFIEICENRIRKHAHNAVLIVKNPEQLIKNAGQGLRQGKDDEGPITGSQKITIGIVVSQFNNEITDRMLKQAKKTAAEEGAAVQVAHVAGVFDMPLVIKKMLMDKKIAAVAALGAVIKGETAHDEVITKDAARRIGDLSLEFRKPVTYGVIGYDADFERADERAEPYADHAVKTAILLINTLRQ